MDTSELFLVRVWREVALPDRAAFRASVRKAGGERAAFFTEPEELVRFIEGCMRLAGETGRARKGGSQ